MAQLLSFCGYVSASVKPPPAIRLLKGMHRSRPAEWLQLFFACDVFVVTGIRWEASQSATVIELLERKR